MTSDTRFLARFKNNQIDLVEFELTKETNVLYSMMLKDGCSTFWDKQTAIDFVTDEAQAVVRSLTRQIERLA